MSFQSISQRIRKVQFKMRKILSGAMVGDRSTALKGSGFEFDQIREYQQGDDVRFIDWKSTAKTGKFLTRQYFEERNHRIMIALDVSASTLAGCQNGGKSSLMAELAAIFALVAEYNHDQVGLTLFSDRICTELPISSGQAHNFRLMKTIFNQQATGGVTDFNLLFADLNKKLKAKSLIIVISDFISQHNFSLTLKKLKMRHQVLLIRCLDQLECELPAVGILPIVDPETGATAQINLADFHKLNAILRDRITEQNSVFRRLGVDLLQINHENEIASAVIKFFLKQLTY